MPFLTSFYRILPYFTVPITITITVSVTVFYLRYVFMQPRNMRRSRCQVLSSCVRLVSASVGQSQ